MQRCGTGFDKSSFSRVLVFWQQPRKSLQVLTRCVDAPCIHKASIRLRASVQGEEQCFKATPRTVGAVNLLNWGGYFDVALNRRSGYRLGPTSLERGSGYDQPHLTWGQCADLCSPGGGRFSRSPVARCGRKQACPARGWLQLELEGGLAFEPELYDPHLTRCSRQDSFSGMLWLVFWIPHRQNDHYRHRHHCQHHHHHHHHHNDDFLPGSTTLTPY